MKHIVNIAFDFDDERVQKILEETAEVKILKDIRQSVMDNIFEKSGWGRDTHADPTKDPIKFWVKDMVKDVLMECKEDICKQAAIELADSMKRSKKWREMAMSEVEA